MKKFKLRKFYLGVATFIILLYMEITFRLLTGNVIFSKNIIYVLIFNLIISLFFDIIGRIFNRKTNKIIFLINLFLLSLLYSIQLCVFKMFSFYFDFGLLGASGQVASFAGDGVDLVIRNISGIILLFMPFILFTIFNKKIVIERENKKSLLIKSGLCLVSIGSFYLFLQNGKDKINSPYKLYYEVNNIDLNIRTFGVLDTFVIDTYRLVFGFDEKIDIIIKDNNGDNDNADNPEEIIYEYNNLDIDFDALISGESNKTNIGFVESESNIRVKSYIIFSDEFLLIATKIFLLL